MRRKDASVSLDLREEIKAAADILDGWHQELTGRELVVTSGSEPIKHSVPRSAHYRRDAIDIRNWYLKEQFSDLDDWRDRIQGLLGPDFVVINERTHFHIHWSPIYAG